MREQLVAGIKAVSEGVARTDDMPDDRLPAITMGGGSTPLVNEDGLADRLARALRPVIGSEKVVTNLPPATASEDCQLLKGPHRDVPPSLSVSPTRGLRRRRSALGTLNQAAVSGQRKIPRTTSPTTPARPSRASQLWPYPGSGECDPQ